MKFDYIIQNPPYSGSLHLDFLKKGFDLLTENGKMTIIEPATWLINVRKNGKAKLYDEIKSRLGKHVKKVVIENLNREFDTALYVPFSITYIDLEKEYDEIDYQCFGIYKSVNNLYDCNLIGSYDMLWSILNKCKNYGNMMKDHICKNNMNNNNLLYCVFSEILPSLSKLHGYKCDEYKEYNLDINYTKNIFKNSEYNIIYTGCVYYLENYGISKNYPKLKGPGGKFTDKDCNHCLYGSKQELENWKHFVFNNKLPLFISLVLTIDQHNNSKEFTPWLTDKQYTDEEIYNLLGITKDEQEFIDKTLKKYERHSPWFKRYMCGKDSVSSEEVQKFIDNL